MKVLITGHRLFKLKNYDCDSIRILIEDAVDSLPISIGLSGMASGVDLWYCEILKNKNIPYWACIPFEEQQNEVEDHEKLLRLQLIDSASEKYNARNRFMVDKSDAGIVVWDGNKGGTHNVLQQLVENKKPFVWINPVSNIIYKCLN